MGQLTTEFTTWASVAGAGSDWSNPANAQIVDVNNAVCVLGLGQQADLLRGSNLRQKVTRNCVAVGIGIAITKSASVAMAILDDYGIQLNIGGSASNPKDVPGYWAVTEAVASYGGASDLWGLTPSRENLNATTCRIDVGCIADGAAADAQVDAIIPTIHYRQTHMRCRAGRAGYAGRGHERAPF